MSKKAEKKKILKGLKTTKSVRVVAVERDETDKVLSVRIQCYHKIDMQSYKVEVCYHDVVFVPYLMLYPNGKKRKWVRIQERISGGYVPLSRFHRMAEQATAIIWEKK